MSKKKGFESKEKAKNANAPASASAVPPHVRQSSPGRAPTGNPAGSRPSSPLRDRNPDQFGGTHDIHDNPSSDQASEDKQNVMVDLIKQNLHISPDCTHLEAELVMNTPMNFQPPEMIIWPTGVPEEFFYKDLAAYLNACLDATRKAVESGARDPQASGALGLLFPSDFRWVSLYEKHVLGNAQTTASLKPDIFGCILDLECSATLKTVADDDEKKCARGDKMLGDNQYVAWEDAVTFAEVKKQWPEMVAQSATYARQVFANQPDRVAVRCVLFNQKYKDAAIAEFDRAGVYVTRLHRLDKKVDFNRFSLLLAGMYCSSTDAHGYDQRIEWRSNSKRKLTSLSVMTANGKYGVKNILCNRVGLWGRVTRAFHIEKGEQTLAGGGNANDGLAVIEDVEDSKRKSVSKRPTLPSALNRPPFRLQGAAGSNAPAPVLINYWQHLSHRNDVDREAINDLMRIRKEGQSVRGIVNYGQRQEGRVTLFARGPAEDSTKSNYYYKDRYGDVSEDQKQNRKQHDTDTAACVFKILSEDKKYKEKKDEFKEPAKLVSSLNKSAASKFDPYPRYETLQECLELGKSLMDAANGFELVDGILGALYGYRNLYYLGYLHRDISPGNIIIVKPEARKSQEIIDIKEDHDTVTPKASKGKTAETKSPEYKTLVVSNKSNGMLIDLSLAIKRDRQKPHSEITPGLTGTRMFISRYLLTNVDKKYTYSAIFDLESFLWSFVYVLLRQNRKRRTADDYDILKMMIPDNNRTYALDGGQKAELMVRFKNKKFADPNGVLSKYIKLINDLSIRAGELYEKTGAYSFRDNGYKPEDETAAIEGYIEDFEKFLEQNVEFLKKDKFDGLQA